MPAWRCFAPAKLNLYLHVTGRCADGMHLLDGLVAFATVGDEVAIAPADTMSLAVTGPFASSLVGAPGENLVWRAAEALARHLGITPTVAIRLTKNLPVASGIGGGSSDAAAALRALAALWHCEDASALNDIAASLGSDVPACLLARPAWLGGVGADIKAASPLPAFGVVLVNPNIPLPTASVYRAFKGPYSPPSRLPVGPDATTFAYALAERNSDLTGTAIGLVPAIGIVLKRLARIETNLLTRMSGSGATCFGLFKTSSDAEEAARQLHAEQPDWWIAAASLADAPVTVSVES